MDKIKYVNHLGETLDLRSGNIMSSYFALKNFVQSMTNNRLTSEGKSTPLLMVCLTKADANKLIDVLEKDSITNEYGKFYINDWYIEVIYQGVTIIGEYGEKVKLEVSFYAEDTIFTKETHLVMTAAATQSSEWLNFPFTYPFTFGSDVLSHSNIQNTEFLGADFIMKISHPTPNVSVTIGKHQYFVDSAINENETFVLNTFDKKVYKQSKDGIASLFGASSDDSYIFESIPNGTHKVVWDGDFPLNITLLEHRRTPKWI